MKKRMKGKKKKKAKNSPSDLLSQVLQPPAGLERFVSPDVVRTLIAFGADVPEAARRLIAFLTQYKGDGRGQQQQAPMHDDDVLSWKTLLMQVLPKQRRIKQSDMQALETVFAQWPEDWDEIRGAVHHSAAVTDREGGVRKLGCVVPKRRVLWIL
ncbi:hypothetical protein PG994_003313 [Apiospora phragmitis]|uniref:Uncharacterized protein n=1 Tax=Apiospora phragmitis TaxID=2905665 RepID=A0ABR1W0F7_9PEZI